MMVRVESRSDRVLIRVTQRSYRVHVRICGLAAVLVCGIFGRSLVKAGLMQQDQCDQDADDYADVQTQEIERKKTFILFDAAPGRFEIVSKHGIDLWPFKPPQICQTGKGL